MQLRLILLLSLIGLISVSYSSKAYESYSSKTQEWYLLVENLKKSLEVNKAILASNEPDYVKAEAALQVGSYYMAIKSAESIGYLTKAANYADIEISSPASYNLGMVYLHGKGVAVDLEQSFIWFSAAAKKSNIGAIREISIMCRDHEVSDESLNALAQWSVEAKNQDKESVAYLAGEYLREEFASCETTKAVINQNFL